MESNTNNVKKEEKVTVRGYVTPKFVILTAVAAGTGLYLVGRSKGFNAGYSMGQALGRANGYEEGIKSVSNVIKQGLQSMDDK